MNGQLKVLNDSSKAATIYEGRCSLLSDPNVYIKIVQSTGCRNIVMSDLPLGVEVRIQVRSCGPNGWSEWSDITIIMVI